MQSLDFRSSSKNDAHLAPQNACKFWKSANRRLNELALLHRAAVDLVIATSSRDHSYDLNLIIIDYSLAFVPVSASSV
jgi:hypothetical protein